MRPCSAPCLAALALAASLALVATSAAAQVNDKNEKAEKPEKVEKIEKASATPAEAGAACERAARQQLEDQVPNAADVSFDGAPALQHNLSNDSQLVLRGAGKHRAAGAVRSFGYSCNVDARTGKVVGLVLRDGMATVVAAAPPKPPAEPDLTHVSPEACESSAVVALKQRWPRVSQISFDGGTRTFRQDSDSSGRFHGNGRALREPGAPATLFGFDCEIDPRDGRVLGTQLSG